MSSDRFRFGLFEFDAAARELRREGVLVRLQSQPAQVLACLIERAGQVVNRDELRETVWGSETFVDFDRGLNFCISQVRAALKDDPVEPRYIRTIPKRGYQFIAPLEKISQPAPPAPRLVQRRGRVLAVSGAILVVLLVTGYWSRSTQSAKAPPVVAVVRFDNETGDPGTAGFSDGLTDNVVEQLTSLSQGRYSVIGNAQILRQPRDGRDLKAIASSLHADYVILGQVQSGNVQSGSVQSENVQSVKVQSEKGPPGKEQIRILAHLIRLPDQTHIKVARMDRTLEDPLNVESELAQKIAARFSPLLAEVVPKVEPKSPSSPSANR